MKFSSRESIDAPIEDVFLSLSDFSTYERSAIRRGAEVQRVDTLGRAGVGAQWNAQVMMCGTQRNLTIALTEYDQPNRMRFDTVTGGFEAVLSLDTSRHVTAANPVGGRCLDQTEHACCAVICVVLETGKVELGQTVPAARCGLRLGSRDTDPRGLTFLGARSAAPKWPVLRDEVLSREGPAPRAPGVFRTRKKADLGGVGARCNQWRDCAAG